MAEFHMCPGKFQPSKCIASIAPVDVTIRNLESPKWIRIGHCSHSVFADFIDSICQLSRIVKQECMNIYEITVHCTFVGTCIPVLFIIKGILRIS